MSEPARLLPSIQAMLTAENTALHNGDAGPRIAMWSHREPVTLFGAAATKVGWAEVAPVFTWLASRFSNCTSHEMEVLAGGVSGDLAYIVAIERTTASVSGGEPKAYALRVTTILRREDGEWKVVHRHGDPYEEAAARLVGELSA